jgi:nitroimidazol reductase NimA-like FMN-containing flavoprotein (pyridoxamine 5'-phosphate oxidase superfamily)
MRRSEKEIADAAVVMSVIEQSLVCRLGMSDGYRPYVVPLCFGYQDGCLYFHSAPDGEKIDMIRKNSQVCFEFDINAQTIQNELACNWSMKYQSVIGFGKAVIVEDIAEKSLALEVIMRQYSDKDFSIPKDALEAITVVKVLIDSMTGKQSGY